jgi:hypothetical protein
MHKHKQAVINMAQQCLHGGEMKYVSSYKTKLWTSSTIEAEDVIPQELKQKSDPNISPSTYSEIRTRTQRFLDSSGCFGMMFVVNICFQY